MRIYKDTDGDIWYEGASGRLHSEEMNARREDDEYGVSKQDVENSWGPLELISGASDGTVTRVELAEILHAIGYELGYPVTMDTIIARFNLESE